MTPEDAAAATAGPIGSIASHFMLDMATYATGAELGFEGMDFYVGGRCGPLGDVVPEAVSSCLVFFEPETVRTSWERCQPVMPRLEAAAAFLGCGNAWAEDHLAGADVDLARLAELTGRVIAEADGALAPIFTATRALAEPTSTAALAFHRMNLLRELRFAFHAAATLSAGLAPLEALSHRTPGMVPIFGWAEAWPEGDVDEERWQAAERVTDARMAVALSVLDERELDELVVLMDEAHSASS